MNVRDAYDEVYAYTMGRPAFILQHVVDAFGAQTATAETTPIRLIFSLAGLDLHVERRFSGGQVQLAHVTLGKRKRVWPSIPLPADRGVSPSSTCWRRRLDQSATPRSMRGAGRCGRRFATAARLSSTCCENTGSRSC